MPGLAPQSRSKAAAPQSLEPRPQPYADPRLAAPVNAEADVQPGRIGEHPSAVGCGPVLGYADGPGSGGVASGDKGTASSPAFPLPIWAST